MFNERNVFQMSSRSKSYLVLFEFFLKQEVMFLSTVELKSQIARSPTNTCTYTRLFIPKNKLGLALMRICIIMKQTANSEHADGSDL